VYNGDRMGEFNTKKIRVGYALKLGFTMFTEIFAAEIKEKSN
jgi:hypothetical protein